MKTITILYNTASYVYKFRMNLIKEIQRHGYKVVVLSPYDEYVERLKENNIEHYTINMSQYGMNPLKELKTIFQIYKSLKKYNPEYSLHYTIKPNIFGGIAASLLDIKVINNIAGAGKSFNKDGIFQKFIKLLYRQGLKKSQKVFFQNYDDMNLFLKDNIVKEKIATRIPGSGVDLIKYKHIPLANEEMEFLFLGRLLKEKGIEYYLEAADTVSKKNNKIRFIIVGEYNENNNDYIDKDVLDSFLENPNINYLGSVSPDEIPKIITKCCCIVLPSYYREGVPRSLLEAASIGRSIITTHNVGCKEVVDENLNGYKCPIKDSFCLAEKMVKFSELDFSNKLKMGRYSRNKVEKEFDEKSVIKAYLEVMCL